MVRSVSGGDLWAHDMEGGGATRLSFLGNNFAALPAWTPSGDEVVQSWFSEGVWALRAHSADRSGGVRELGPGLSLPAFFSQDGKTLFYAHPNEQGTPELWKKTLAGEGPAEPLLSDAGISSDLALSPDGRFLAYPVESKILVRSFPEMAGPWEVASGGPRRRRVDPRGEHIYFIQGRDVMEVGVTTRPSFPRGILASALRVRFRTRRSAARPHS
jgi:tricorn protease-like protein